MNVYMDIYKHNELHYHIFRCVTWSTHKKTVMQMHEYLKQKIMRNKIKITLILKD